jgi:hypothetical protein
MLMQKPERITGAIAVGVIAKAEMTQLGTLIVPAKQLCSYRTKSVVLATQPRKTGRCSRLTSLNAPRCRVVGKFGRSEAMVFGPKCRAILET